MKATSRKNTYQCEEKRAGNTSQKDDIDGGQIKLAQRTIPDITQHTDKVINNHTHFRLDTKRDALPSTLKRCYPTPETFGKRCKNNSVDGESFYINTIFRFTQPSVDVAITERHLHLSQIESNFQWVNLHGTDGLIPSHPRVRSLWT